MKALCFLLTLCAVGLLPRSSACPKYCYCDSYEKDEYSVRCNGANITAIPRDIPKNTTMLDISFTPITMLRKGDFVDMPKLKQLNVWWNFNLTMVELGTFDNLPTITSLGLDQNNIKDLKGVFEDLPQLQSVSVFGNQLTSIEGVFINLPKLDNISLSGNKISKISSTTFNGVSAMTSLTISSNAIAEVESGASRNLDSLETLHVDNNQIPEISLAGLHSLMTLSIDSNNLQSFPTNLEDANQLETLSLNNNPIKEPLEEQFSVLHRMEVLDSGTLVVTDAREEDTGVYTCTAVNYRGKASKEVSLHVGNKH
uniref:LRRNT domain-containing protein n=1 Tax=Branchiostoma floridae TaxID=7739 RepID=C3XRQ7_BRAFL|eukprot:XP_002613366.1 hypothetical protein BRAFLDRAFT_68351 [Branchiostoma floridae]